jgi:HEAT repeat protein
MAQRREFEGRMLAILDENASRESPSVLHAASLAVLALLLLLPISAMAPAPAGSLGSGAELTPKPGLAPRLKRAGDLSPSLLGALLAGLEETQAGQRADAANALGTLKAGQGVASLGSHLMRDPDPEVRLTAAWALGQIASSEASDALSTAALREEVEDVRAMAVWALGQVRDPAALSKLEVALRDPSPEVRLRAAWAVGNTEPSQAPESLVAALRDTDPRVAEMAAWALGQIRDPSTVPALADLVGDGKTWTKAGLQALWSLAEIGGEAAREPIEAALEMKLLDKKMAEAVRLALAGESVPPRPNHWPIPAIR